MDSILIAARDFDPTQVAIVVIFVLAGFIKWLWENWQLKREAGRREQPIDPEEQRLRDEAWRRQIGQGQGQPRPAPPVPASPATGSSWDELKKAWNELKEAAKQAQSPAPPPLPRPAQRPQQASRVQPPSTGRNVARASQPPADTRPVAVSISQVPSEPQDVASLMGEKVSSPSPILAAMYNLRRDPALLRQAVLMHEVLSPPKALQSSSETAI